MKTKIEENASSIIFEKKLNKSSEKDINDNKNKLNENIFEKDSKFNSIKLSNQYFPLINLILFELIFILLPKRILLDNPYIELKVISTGYQQILSEKYSGVRPSAIYVNNEVQILKDFKVLVESAEYKIRMEWENSLTDFTYMFYNLSSITSAKMNKITGKGCNLSYVFYNCNNLENFSYVANGYNYSYIIIDTIGMFYNCSSLRSFDFTNLYMECPQDYCSSWNYKIRNFSYMFYNCQNIKSIYIPNNIKFINDMRSMFYNCYSLTSIDITKFYTKYSASNNASYMFYNCSLLSELNIPNNIYMKDMNNMFYNCKSLNYINLTKFYSNSELYVNMSRLFYNCHNLMKIDGNLNNVNISDAREMFFNCTSLKYRSDGNFDININIKHNLNININMSKMFYNCLNIEIINIYGDSEHYIAANDFNSMFYNCSNLDTINFNYINTTNIQNMSYMFYNCKKLKHFNRDNFTYNENSIVNKRNMKGMFQNCESLSYLNLTNNFYTKNVEIMWDMFKGCSNLESLDLLSFTFDTSQVTDMESMFEGCYNLVSLNISNFNTQKVLYMNRMFYNCSSLKSLYFHYISSNSLGNMQHMFYNCSKLEYLDLYSLSEKSQSIVEMFKGASTNFQFCIEENENIPNIFKLLLEMPRTTRDCDYSCYYNNARRAVPEKKLCCKYVEYNGNCYDKCPSRTRTNSGSDKQCEYFSCDYYYNYEQNDCTDSLPYQHYVNDTNLKTIDKCHPDCATCSSKAIDSNHTNCLTCVNSKYIYLGNCYSQCLRGSYINYGSGKRECYCFEEKCKYCPEEYAKQGKCQECNNTGGYYKREIDGNPPYNCYKQLDKYYLDKNYKVFKQCYKSCQTCNQSGWDSQHNCLSCDSEHSLALQNGNYLNCYSNCSYYFYFDRNNKFNCRENFTCPIDYDLIVPEIGQCVKFCNETGNYKYEFRKKCYSKCPIDSEEDKNEKYTCFLSCPFERPFMLKSKQICVSTCTINERRDKECITNYFGNRTNEEIQDKILTDIEDHLTSNTFNYTNINDELYIIDETKTNYELTTTNKKGPSRPGISYVRLAECEATLRQWYNIDEKEPLYMLKFDIDIEGKEGPTVDYRVYYPLGDDKTTLEPLSLTICEGRPVFISFAINITGDPDLYNKNSPYYNDLCISYSTNDGIDLTIEDRQNQYIENNRSLCEEDCFFVGYDSTTNIVECSCEVKFTLPLISEIRIDKNKLYKFMDIKKIANFDVLKCYKLIFSKVGIIKNFGLYLYLPTFIMYFVTIFLFYIKEFNLIKKQINDIAYAKKFLKYLEDKKRGKIKPIQKPLKKDYRFKKPIIHYVAKQLKEDQKRISVIKLQHNIIKEEKKENDLIEENNITKEIDSEIKKDELIENNSKEEETNNQSKIKEDKLSAPPIKDNNRIPNRNPKRSSEISFGSSKNNLQYTKNELNLNTNNNIKDFGVLTKEEKERIKLIMKHNDSELNILEYKEALIYDDRNYFQYYCSLLRTKHLIVKIISETDYNSRIIKIFLCFFNFSLSFTVNTLFFSDDTMHKILEDGGEFNFIYQLPQIIYSTIISIIINNILIFLALSEENVLSIKHEKILRNVPRKVKETIRALQIKFINFFILSFIFFMGFWYYASCFCAVYKNTQYHLIKDSLISYGTSLITPLGINLFPGIFRIPGIKGQKEFLYLISKVIQLF